ncbi:FAD-dependent monooxygenase [Streptantibioticus cattleyicolor]|uniref:Oxygenase n=1 Tax=Streptantibioticus cattleyicolor (strain ATCC 35852 / DSM 46488 / JCM 4925 / NBRC 14057 / NRRL 8057) TaxID=1003195 RepID=F8JIW1_STREN|nr:FAD-dependent monooxygenase [Streptantibioticus cattleyicolor]AEW98954.1 oxygenase [Streptantibioticus cattleyicolor NRRL 8057 = DSM 46488]CCB72000.1 2-polyprenyl-6-methoxyphenol hydroxylase-like oxidoreductase [Streptantibioticus cattleyicolor NRRL 8057 = DSM 46488]
MDYDVTVAGAGPAGLMTACELALGGARVVVVERLTEPDPTIKAGSINIPTAQALDRRGLLPRLAEAQRRTFEGFDAFVRDRREAAPDKGEPVRMAPRFAGHFAGLMLRADLVDPDDPAFADVGPAGEVGLVPQQEIERILAARAAGLGVTVRRGVELTGFDEDADGVTVHLAASDGGPAGAIRSGWLVGCDGGRSLVRKLAGFDFPGTDPLITGHQALVDLTGAEALNTGWNRTDTGVYAYGPLPGRILTVEFDGPPADRNTPVTAAELETSLRRVSGADVTVTAVHTATRFTDNARQVTSYRRGRVLLAGDAAHVHSPFGGQGLNLGIGDALNLGWKLAAVVRGRAEPSLLDTYTAERHPIGAWVLEWTRAQILLMRPEPRADALRRVVGDLVATTTGASYFTRRISGVWQRYDLPGDHPLTGASAPDLELADGRRLADLLHGGRGLLLDLTGDPAVKALADGYGDRVDAVTASCPARPDLAALLIRPDGFVAWAAATDATERPVHQLPEALSRWFGTPAT